MSIVVLQPSRILAAILVIAHGLAAGAVIAAGMPFALQLFLLLVLAANVAFEIWRRAMLRSADAVVAIEIAPDDTLRIQTRRGDWIRCEALGSTYVASFLVVLNLRAMNGEGTRRAIILSDSLDAEDFRKLRVWLRWKAIRPTQ